MKRLLDFYDAAMDVQREGRARVKCFWGLWHHGLPCKNTFLTDLGETGQKALLIAKVTANFC